jgi:hypothetical protein
MEQKLIELNEFESEIIACITAQNPRIRPLIQELHPIRREFTGAGSYTNFRCRSEGGKAWHLVIEGLIEVKSAPYGLQAAIFFKGSEVDFLEIFTIGTESWDGDHEGFTIMPTT